MTDIISARIEVCPIGPFRCVVRKMVTDTAAWLSSALIQVVDAPGGSGEQAIGNLARYLYRGVLSERDLLGWDDTGKVRFRYRESQTGERKIRSLPGADFLALLLQHVLPKGFHRVRDYGLLHPKRSALLRRIQLMLQVRLSMPSNEDAPPDTPTWRCPHCGGRLRIIATRLAPQRTRRRPEYDKRSDVM